MPERWSASYRFWLIFVKYWSIYNLTSSRQLNLSKKRIINESRKSRSVSLCLCCHRDVCSGPLQAAHRLVRLSLRVSGDFSNKAPLQLSVPGNCLKSASVACGLFCCGVFLRRPATRCYVTSPSSRIRPRPLLLLASQLRVCPCYVIL